jgi:hypothetical protein
LNLAAQGENIMKRTTLFLAALAMVVAAACKDEPPRMPPPPPPPPPPAAKPAAPAVDGGAPLGMVERARLHNERVAAERKLAAENAAAEEARLLKFDKSKLAKHLALFDFEKKTRQALDQAAEKLNGKIHAADDLKKLVTSQRKVLEKQAAALRALDPKGGNTFIGTDHDVYLNLLSEDYPAAILDFFEGKTKPLAEVRAEMDKREKKIGSWLAEVQASKK